MSFMTSLGAVLRLNKNAGLRQAEVRRLSAKSDADLENIGIRRDRIVQHVCRDFIGL